MFLKIVGVTFENRQNLIKKLQVNEELKLVREPNNLFDKNAVAVYNGGHQLGYIGKNFAKFIARRIDAGIKYKCFVTAVTGGCNGARYGANICIEPI